MRVILAGGGTGGPVMPLIAVAEEIKSEHRRAEFLFIGTYSGLEKKVAREHKMRFVAVPAGKWRRYFSLLNFFAPFFIIAGFIRSLFIIQRFKPDVVFAAGGFVAVPVCYAAFCFRKKIIIHQQDIIPSLTNKLIAPIASRITVTFKHSIKDFSSTSGLFSLRDKTEKITWTGNPVRKEVLEKPKKTEREIKDRLGLKNDLPTIVFLGGATGAATLNLIIDEALPELVAMANVIHVTGRGKSLDFQHENYHAYEFIDKMGEVLRIADIVVSRAGLSTISELAVLKKVAMIIPLPDSHQLLNAYVLARDKAALVFEQGNLYPGMLVNILKKLMYDGDLQRELSENIGSIMPRNAAQKIANLIVELCQK